MGDAAEMCIIEFVDFNETYVAGVAPEAKAKTRRSRSAGAKKEGDAAEVAVEGEAAAEKSAPAKKAPAAKKPATAKKPAAARPAPKVSSAKAQSVKTGASKKA